MYLDKLEGNVNAELFEALRRRTRAELTELEVQRRAIGKAEESYFDLGALILELAQTAPRRFKAADDATRREIVLELVRTAALRNGKVEVSLREPFKTLWEGNEKRLQRGALEARSENWYSGRDSNPRSSP